MLLKLKQIWGTNQVLGEIARTTGTNAKANYWIGKLISSLQSELKSIEEQRNDLIKKYGEQKEDKSYSVLPDNMETFVKEFSDLLETEVEVNITKVSLSTLEGRNLSANAFVALNFAINEPVEDNG